MSRSVDYRGGKGMEAIARVTMSLEDLLAIIGGLREASEALEDWEFELRMGVTRTHVKELLDYLGQQFDLISSAARD